MDSTGLYLIFREEVINEAIKELTYIESNTGLKISYDKTCIYRVGSLKGTDAKIYTTKNLQWSDGGIEMLGVTIRNNEQQNCEQMKVVLHKVECVTSLWENQKLTLLGKTLLVN